MNPITYSLCQKPVIGIVMWITSLCAFPPLFSDEPIDLAVAGSTAIKYFTAPVDKSYPLVVTFEFASVDARLNDQVVGDRYSENCQGKIRYEEIPEIKRRGLGRPIPFKVVIRNVADNSVITYQIIESLCTTSHNGSNKKNRTIGRLALPNGDYIAEVTNLQAQSGLTGVHTSISLYGGQGK